MGSYLRTFGDITGCVMQSRHGVLDPTPHDRWLRVASAGRQAPGGRCGGKAVAALGDRGTAGQVGVQTAPRHFAAQRLFEAAFLRHCALQASALSDWRACLSRSGRYTRRPATDPACRLHPHLLRCRPHQSHPSLRATPSTTVFGGPARCDEMRVTLLCAALSGSTLAPNSLTAYT
jgi:hypothetical protein